MAQDKEAFLARWSRRKRDADKETQEQDAPPKAPPEDRQQASIAPRTGEAPAQKAPELTPLDKLTAESDFREFMDPTVDDDTRRAALKKLFADPRFNVIDEMDIYIDDYTNMEKLPPEMLKKLAHAQRTLFGWGEQKNDEAAEQTPEEGAGRLADAQDKDAAAEERPASDSEQPAKADPKKA